MRALFPALLALHGAIHLLGFLKWSGLANLPQLNDRLLLSLSRTGARAYAGAWLVAAALLLGAAVLRAARGGDDGWWRMALAGALLSQVLIVLAWPDAKAGTVANLIILIPVIVAAAHARFESRVDAEARALLSDARRDSRVVTAEDLRGLPAPVQHWLTGSGVVGQPRAATVRLHQRGELRTKPNGPWMRARAEQYFSVEPPGFVWKVEGEMMRVVPITGRDRYAGGRGHMLIKAASVMTVADAADAAIDLGSMLRYLAEIIWFPSAALAPTITWEPIDATHARAKMAYGEAKPATAVFTFDAGGRAVRFDAERPLGGGANAKLTPWFGSSSEWRTFEGVEVPIRGEVGWELPTGTFIYYKWEISDVEYNRFDLFSERVEPSHAAAERTNQATRAVPSPGGGSR